MQKHRFHTIRGNKPYNMITTIDGKTRKKAYATLKEALDYINTSASIACVTFIQLKVRESCYGKRISKQGEFYG